MNLKAVIFLVTTTLAACNSVHTNANSRANKTATPAPAAAQTNDDIRRVTTTELDDLMKQGKVLVLDVRNKDMYDRGHIRGAKLIPVQDVGQRARELPRDKMIVAYCS
jgi:predicted sulfurtransferase